MKMPLPKRRVNSKAAEFRLRIGRSSSHRYGLFALEDIPRGRRVIEYTGKRITLYQAWEIQPPKDIYLVHSTTSGWCLDGASGGSGAEFINHSCDPNLQWRRVGKRLLFFSRRKIRAGEELTWKYQYPVKLERVPCKCGSRQCRGTLRFILS
jgi:uncharacterized protein